MKQGIACQLIGKEMPDACDATAGTGSGDFGTGLTRRSQIFRIYILIHATILPCSYSGE